VSQTRELSVRMRPSLLGEVCPRYKDGVCPDGDDCPYTHPSEGTSRRYSHVLARSLTRIDWSDDTQTTPIESASSPTTTPRASYFPQVEMRAAADKGAKQLDCPTPELIPDISPIVARGPPPILGVREELPPRPFSTPPRINSRTEGAAPTKTCVAQSIIEAIAVLTPYLPSQIQFVKEHIRTLRSISLSRVVIFVFFCGPSLDLGGQCSPNVLGSFVALSDL